MQHVLAIPAESQDQLRVSAPSRQIRIDARAQAACFLIACAVLVLRRPDMLFHARFYVEDGSVFYATAHNYGWWRVLFSPYRGYVHLFPRLAAALALLVPLKFAPLVENIAALCVEALPVPILLSAEWERLRFRAVLASIYLLLPNTADVYGRISDSQWILALCVLLILLSAKQSKSIARYSLTAMSSFTGPFCIFLLPVAIYLKRKVMVYILGAGAALQICAMLYAHAGHRYLIALGAGIMPFFRILGSQMVIGTLLGRNGAWLMFPITTSIIGIIGVIVVGYVALKESREFKILAVFSLAVFAASICNPANSEKSSGYTVWQFIEGVHGTRYAFFPCLVFAWGIAYGFRTRLKAVAIALAVLMVIGVARDFRLPFTPDFQYATYVRQFQDAPKGAVIVIPTAPAGWQMTLIKH